MYLFLVILYTLINWENQFQNFLLFIKFSLHILSCEFVLQLKCLERQINEVFLTNFQYDSIFIHIQCITANFIHTLNSWKFKFNSKMAWNFNCFVIRWILQKLRVINWVCVDWRIFGLLNAFIQVLNKLFLLLNFLIHLILFFFLFIFFLFLSCLLLQICDLFLQFCLSTLCISLNDILFRTLSFIVSLAFYITKREQSWLSTFTYKIFQNVVVFW